MAVDPKLLQNLPPFRDLPERQLRLLGGMATERTVSVGQTIFVEGEPGKAIFVMTCNDIELLYQAGREALAGIEWVKAGDVLGVQAMLPPYRYQSTASSLTEGCMLMIDAVKLRAMCEVDGGFATTIYECLMAAMLNRSHDLRSRT